jgi:hypothetical protein
MVPPKVIAPSRTTRKTHNAMRSPQEQAIEETNRIHLERLVYMDVIPSPVINIVIPKLVEE